MDDHEASIEIDIEEDTPVANPPAPSRRLGLEPDDIPLKRVFLHLVESRENAALVGGRNPLNRFSGGTGEEQLPVHGGGRRASRGHCGQ